MTKSLPLLYHSPPVREAGQELKQMPQKSAAYWLVYLDLLSASTTQAHLPRAGIVYSELGPSMSVVVVMVCVIDQNALCMW